MSHLRRCPKQLVIEERCIYHAELETCPACGEPLHLSGHYSWRKTIQQLDKVVYVASRPRECRNPACRLHGQRYISAAAQSVALPHSTYGLDVVAQIGWWRDREHLSNDEIYARLHKRVQISRRHVDLLLYQYRLLLASAEQPDVTVLQAAVDTYGGLIISIDGLEPEGGQEQLWVVREVLTGTVLAAAWLPRVNETTLTTLLQPVQAWLVGQQWAVLATLSDKQAALALALAAVWPDCPHQWCQAHYLRNLAQPVYARDLALKTALRQEVRHALRRSLAEVSTAAPEGDFSPQVVTGVVLLAEPVAAPPGLSPEADLVHQYARLLQASLGRQGRAPFVLAGVALWDDLQALQASLERLLSHREEPHLRLWQDTLARILPTYVPDFAAVREGQAWLTAIRQVLDAPPVPTRAAPGLGGAAVALALAHFLGPLADRRDLTGWLEALRTHLFKVSTSYWPGLFGCYDVVGLPRTNNDLEGLFGQTKRRSRRQTGLHSQRRVLLRHGGWLLYSCKDATAEALRQRLAQVPRAAYRAARGRFEKRQEQFRQRHRWCHDRPAVLAQLETRWTALEAKPC